MGKRIKTVYPETGKGWCEIHLDVKDESLYIKYFNEGGVVFFTEDFPNKSMHYVQDAADNWAVGIKKLEIN